ncbi:MAG: hypothetical protein ACYCW6_18475 [Candidatus Xenobia bacterium]
MAKRPLLLAAWLVATLLLLAWSLAPVDSIDTDLFWHLADGQRTLTGHGVELADPFSWTYYGHPWLRTEWLFDVGLYGLWTLGGMNLLIAARSVLFIAAFVVMAAATRPRGLSSAAIGLSMLGAAEVASRYYPIRPHLLTLLLLALVFWLLEITPMNARVRWVLPPLFAFWINCHGAAVMGVALVTLHIVARWLEAAWQHQERPAIPWLLLLACVGALLLTPQVGRNLLYPILFTIAPDGWQRAIGEFAPLDPGSPQNTWFLIYLAMAWCGAVLAIRQRKPLDLVLTALCTVLSLRAMRHQFLLVYLLIPAVATWLHFLLPRRVWSGRGARAVLALLLLVVGVREVVDIGTRAVPLSRLVFQDAFPEGACRFLIQNRVRGRMYNDLSVGGYYIWRLHDQLPVFIDSRDNIVYDLGLLMKGLDIETQADGVKQLEGLGIDVVAEFDEFDAARPLFNRGLPASPDWMKAYADGISSVWLRRGRFSVAPQTTPFEPYLVAYQNAQAAMARNDATAAAADLDVALAAYPWFPRGHFLKGYVDARLGRSAAAIREWHKALRFDVGMRMAHRNLARLERAAGHPFVADCEETMGAGNYSPACYLLETWYEWCAPFEALDQD